MLKGAKSVEYKVGGSICEKGGGGWGREKNEVEKVEPDPGYTDSKFRI